MSGLRQSVAKAIQADADCGGAGILTDEEIAALEWAIFKAPIEKPAFGGGAESEDSRNKTVLSGLLHELGHKRMFICGETMNRVDKYYLHCADVAIDAYDQWLAERSAALVRSEGK